MSQIKVIKSNEGENAYQNWRNKTFESRVPEYQSQGQISDEILKAEPDLMATPEPTQSEELLAAITVIQEGGLTQLTAAQQKVFQLVVVEGHTNREAAKMLGIDESSVRQHLELIGRKLKSLCDEKL